MRSDKERFLDILEAIENIERYIPRGKQVFETDELIQVWVVRHLQVIGEAASRVSTETQTYFSEIPWGKMIGMRHVLVHGYSILTWILSVLDHDLDPLKEQIQAALKAL